MKQHLLMLQSCINTVLLVNAWAGVIKSTQLFTHRRATVSLGYGIGLLLQLPFFMEEREDKP